MTARANHSQSARLGRLGARLAALGRSPAYPLARRRNLSRTPVTIHALKALANNTATLDGIVTKECTSDRW